MYSMLYISLKLPFENVGNFFFLTRQLKTTIIFPLPRVSPPLPALAFKMAALLLLS